MSKVKTNSRKSPEINASSMADIAFLLLIFFLITTTMDQDKGLLTLLPPYQPEIDQPVEQSNKRNVLEIRINANNKLMVENKLIEVSFLKAEIVKHISNHGLNPNYAVNPKKAIVSLQNDRGTDYYTYFNIHNEIRAAYNQERNTYALKQFGLRFDQLKASEMDIVRKEYPIQLSEAEPVDFAELE